MFTAYRATRSIHLGQIRQDLAPGDVIEFDGRIARFKGKEHRISTMDAIIGNGWLVPVTPEASVPATFTPNLPAVRVPDEPLPIKQPRAPQEPNHATPAHQDQELNLKGERIPYASPEARAASGKRPMSNQKHVWNDTGPSPDWLNSSDGSRTCKVCGVTMRTDLIRVDRRRGDGSQQFHYVDAHGNSIVAFEELACPTYLGDPGSAAAYAKDQVRKVRGRVDDVEDKVDSIEDRLTRLEAENQALRAALAERPVLDADMVAEALLRLAEQAKASKQIETVQARGEAYQIPMTILDVVGERMPEPAVIEAEVVEEEVAPKRRRSSPRRRR